MLQVTLRRIFDGLESKTIHVEGGHFLIGRDKECHLIPICPLVCGRHCEVTVTDTRVIVRDLGSKHGTFVNSERVRDKQQLKHGDVLNVGLACYRVAIAESEGKKLGKWHGWLERLAHWSAPSPSYSYN